MTSVVQPVTFYVPASAGEPVEVKVVHSGLRMVLVNRDSVRLLGDEWKVLGIYFLLGPVDGEADRFRAYVGEVGCGFHGFWPPCFARNGHPVSPEMATLFHG